MNLSLPEKLLLLSLDEEGNNIHIHQGYFVYSFACAVLFELFLKGKVRLNEHQHIVLMDRIVEKDDILSEAIELCTVPNNTIYWIKFKKNAIAETPKEWLQIIAKIPDLRKKYYTRLYQKHLTQEEKKRFLGMIPYTLRPIQNPFLKNKLLQHLRQIAELQKQGNILDIMLLLLIQKSQLLKPLFHLKGKEVKILTQNIQEIIQKRAVIQTIEDELEELYHEDWDKVIDDLYSLTEAISAIADAIDSASDAAGGSDGGDGGGD